MANETARVLQWLYGRLTGDSALMTAAPGGVWRDVADLTTPAPFVVMSRHTGADMITASAARIYTYDVFQVKAIGPASVWLTLLTIADRIDALLGSLTIQVQSGYTILSCYREQSVAYAEIIDGVTWNHLGGLYHINIQAI